MTIFGKEATPDKILEGDSYQWRDRDGNATVPYDQLTAFTRSKGFIDYGILNLVYKLGEMHRVLTNMGITYTLSNTIPIRIIATTQSETTVAGNLARAQRRAAEGKLPIMVDKGGKEFGGVSTLQSNPIINEMNGILDILEKDLGQFGINLNSFVTDTAKTLGALQLEVAASTDLIRYLQKENSPAYERLLQMFATALIERLKDDSDISLVTNVKLRDGDGEMQEVGGVPEVNDRGEKVTDNAGKIKVARAFTLEDLKISLRENEIDFEVSGGVQNNPVVEDQFLAELSATSDPTSKAFMMAKGKRARAMGLNFKDDDFAPNSGIKQPEPMPGGGVIPGGAPPPTTI